MRLRKMFWNVLLKPLTHIKKSWKVSKNVTLLFTGTETVHNLPNLTLTTEQSQLVLYDSKHPIHPFQVNKQDILKMFDFIHLAMTKYFRYEEESSEVKTKIFKLADCYLNSYEPIVHTLKKHRIFERLGKKWRYCYLTST